MATRFQASSRIPRISHYLPFFWVLFPNAKSPQIRSSPSVVMAPSKLGSWPPITSCTLKWTLRLGLFWDFQAAAPLRDWSRLEFTMRHFLFYPPLLLHVRSHWFLEQKSFTLREPEVQQMTSWRAQRSSITVSGSRSPLFGQYLQVLVV